MREKRVNGVLLDEPRKLMERGGALSDLLWVSDTWNSQEKKKMKISLDAKTHISKIREFSLETNKSLEIIRW